MKLTFERFNALEGIRERGVSRRQEAQLADVHGERNLNQLCLAWAEWCRTRRYFGPPPIHGTILGRLGARPSGLALAAVDAPCSAELAAFHLAVVAQPSDSLDRRVFELHYLWRVRNVKAAAASIGISRPHWYRLLGTFRRRAFHGAKAILDANQRALSEMRSVEAGKAHERSCLFPNTP
jgi:hypothetical protein